MDLIESAEKRYCTVVQWGIDAPKNGFLGYSTLNSRIDFPKLDNHSRCPGKTRFFQWTLDCLSDIKSMGYRLGFFLLSAWKINTDGSVV